MNIEGLHRRIIILLGFFVFLLSGAATANTISCVVGASQFDLSSYRAVDGKCVEYACELTGECQYESGLKRMIQACQFVDVSCVRAACESAVDCKFRSELLEILSLCGGRSVP